MKIIKGKPASPGFVKGKALLFGNGSNNLVLKKNINANEVEKELKRISFAIRKTKAQLKKIALELQKVMGKESALIIESQLILLSEGSLIDNIKELIQKKVNAEWAIKKTETKYKDIFLKIQDTSFKEKSNDLSDLLNRLIKNLKKYDSKDNFESENVIIVAQNLPPSITANIISKGKLLGLVLGEGGDTSHSIILARTMGIPSIMNCPEAISIIKEGDELILDGLSGEITINPNATMNNQLLGKQEMFKIYKKKLQEIIALPNKTLDGREFKLKANIELPVESKSVPSSGANGIGLFRTEFLLSQNQEALLSEEEQYECYKATARNVFPKDLVIRTFDIGRDKDVGGFFKAIKEDNPALGTMAVRLFLNEQKLFRNQIRAILRANEAGNIKLLFPMITEIEELNTIKKIIKECALSLKEESYDYHDRKMPIGIMIEIPAIVKIMKNIGEKVDFFSVGSNDLLQYLLAAERSNSNVSHLLSPFHPGALKTLKEVRENGEKIDKELTVCGEIAGQSITAILLLGLGFQSFSMHPNNIPEIKRVLTKVHYSYIKSITNKIINFSSRTEAEEYLIEKILNKYPELFVKNTIHYDKNTTY